MLVMTKQRVVMVSQAVPYDAIPHAGGRYIRTLHRVLSERAEVTLISPNTPATRLAVDQSGAPEGAILVGPPPTANLVGKAARWLAINWESWMRRSDPGVVSLAMAIGLFLDPRARTALRQADVVDLQWMEAIQLAPFVRALNRRARFVGTFHDVQSQSFAREAAPNPSQQRYWRRATRRALAAEGRALRRLDVGLTFSDKDLALLGHHPKVRVVLPPLQDEARDVERRPEGRSVLFVSYLSRYENDNAALWLLHDIWPRVAMMLPDARLRLAGSGASPELIAEATGIPSVELLGYVPDLDAEYARATAAIVPLRHGAGVKFKTVEGLLHGVPTITTPVGSEGIDGPDLFAAVSASATELADAIVAVLRDPDGQTERTAAAKAWAEVKYGHQQFVDAVVSAYSLASTTSIGSS